MRRIIKKILQILDGTPTTYGQHTRGQSVVELALVSPILIVLLMGLAEIGWFTNNYLILLETTRIGARFGTVQNGDTSPQSWNNEASLAPNVYGPNPDDPVKNLYFYRNCDEINRAGREQYQRFYGLLSCVMLQGMSPLVFHGPSYPGDTKYTANGIDDIVISAFSLQLVNPTDMTGADYAGKNYKAQLAQMSTVPADSPQVLVIGRYPTNANECTYNNAGNYAAVERDPFDYIKNDTALDFIEKSGSRLYLELEGYDANSSGTPESQRGFVWSGQHKISDSGGKCYGSEWSIDEVQQLVNLPTFGTLNTAQRAQLASQGMVLVEMFWQHSLLLRNPVFNPVFTIMGNNTTISVWSAFPLPAVEPRIKFKFGS